MKTNLKKSYAVQTHEGGAAFPHVTPLQQLRRSVLSCLLWEDSFYEDGVSIADRIASLCQTVPELDVAHLAIETRATGLRHVPLLLVQGLLARHSTMAAQAIEAVVQRPDELTELLALYWKNGKRPLAKQLKKGLARAFKKFSAYSLAKYNRDADIKLRDVLFLVHPKPDNEAQQEIWNQLVAGTLPAPDTWEVNLSGGADKKETWERLLREGKLGYLALLRNLRNMVDVGVDEQLIKDALLARKGGADKVFPFRYVAAARACPRLEPWIDQALQKAIQELPPLPGKTAVLVDVSGSMDDRLSAKSDLRRIDAACALASIINGDVRMYSFSNRVVEVPPRRGMAGVDALINSQSHQGTHLAQAVQTVNVSGHWDRLIVITDEQAHFSSVPAPLATKAYMINVASYQHGIGYGKWTHIDGFSEAVLKWIHEVELT